jgi:hypothetical protein
MHICTCHTWTCTCHDHTPLHTAASATSGATACHAALTMLTRHTRVSAVPSGALHKLASAYTMVRLNNHMCMTYAFLCCCQRSRRRAAYTYVISKPHAGTI